MHPMRSLAAAAVMLGLFAAQVNAHGQLISPPHRGYMNKAGYSKIPANYDANGLNGGGTSQTAEGKHGICGDPYSAAAPRPHETGGKYGKFPELGKEAIGACYKPGAMITVKTLLTANHLGNIRYQLCELKGKNDRETEECFTTLKFADGTERIPVTSGKNDYDNQVQLPQGVKCDGDSHCVMRWWYRGGNNYGGDSAVQEEFWNCADIYISDNCQGGGGGGSSPSTAPSSSPSSAPTPGGNTTTPVPSSASPSTPGTKTPAPYTNTPSQGPTPSTPVPSSNSPSTPAPSTSKPTKDRSKCKPKDKRHKKDYRRRD